MNEAFDAFLQELQRHILEETKRDFGEKVFERWQNPFYMGVMRDADGHAKVKGICGDSMEIFLKFDNNRVLSASFQTDGCGPTVVCGSYAAEMAFGKTPDELFEITGESILAELGGLPKAHEHCAFLAAASLHATADDYMVKQAGKRRTETAPDRT
ncbi:MAG: iron-sulfur cluster assembly scaffold protein [Candidatus Abyssobacteria bacterium SURF_17]|jgi:nitrogen fixation NifU-like protein|uniref:Iron-sulfur cluster assembly scaffold protein n=1 Tax=Candidatus Abyssobacteria bacterium SURF_17 TaxID=2093361 RepID=A0A419EX36_9BACT|nr:MAG: iron-sulfur cluster assembly scaffold protein [Candidatus Abyssubacteria bacterium SURF_17]